MSTAAHRLAARVRALYGLSRGAQATLSTVQPPIAALVVGNTPPTGRVLAVTLALWAGHLAVFAANDLLDHRLDRERFDAEREFTGFDLDTLGVRHPLARGLIGPRAALAWTLGLGLAAALALALLSALCLALFAAAALLEVLYCRLATVTAAKCLLSGLMVAVGAAIGAAAAPGPHDRPALAALLLWLAAWEIGGRNIPNDLVDAEEDRPLGIRTVPVVLGPRRAARHALAWTFAAAAAAVALAALRAPLFGPAGTAATAAAGLLLLVAPARALLRDPRPETAMRLFNLASFHPPAVLGALLLGLALRH